MKLMTLTVSIYSTECIILLLICGCVVGVLGLFLDLAVGLLGAAILISGSRDERSRLLTTSGSVFVTVWGGEAVRNCMGDVQRGLANNRSPCRLLSLGFPGVLSMNCRVYKKFENLFFGPYWEQK